MAGEVDGRQHGDQKLRHLGRQRPLDHLGSTRRDSPEALCEADEQPEILLTEDLVRRGCAPETLLPRP